MVPRQAPAFNNFFSVYQFGHVRKHPKFAIDVNKWMFLLMDTAVPFQLFRAIPAFEKSFFQNFDVWKYNLEIQKFQ